MRRESQREKVTKRNIREREPTTVRVNKYQIEMYEERESERRRERKRDLQWSEMFPDLKENKNKQCLLKIKLLEVSVAAIICRSEVGEEIQEM